MSPFEKALAKGVFKLNLFSGKILFDLKDSHGLPLEIAIDKIAQEKLNINWIEFIQRARECGWYDFKTYEVLKYALEESFLSKDIKKAILTGIKKYMLEYPQ